MAFGGAASSGNWKNANDAISVGTLIGGGVGLLGSAGTSIGWTPSWTQLGAMWAGFAIGAAATTPIYFVYLGVDADPRTGLIAQGIGGLIGIAVGAIIAPGNKKDYAGNIIDDFDEPFDFAKFVGVGPAGMPGGGFGLQANGLLW
jgi:hypothetical protein